MQQMQATVPAGVGPGMAFQVNTPSGPMQVTCPPDATAGSQMMVNVPVVVMAEAIGGDGAVVAAQPVAAPTPMVMAQPMATTELGAGSGLPWRLSLQVDKKTEMSELKASGQSPIPVISRSDWAEIVAALDETQRGQFFYDSPGCEFVYFCCPGGPIQLVVCMCNPITCALCICPMEAKKTAAKAKIDPIVSKYGLKFRFDDGLCGIFAVIEQ
mmetsp:Transcript_2037/g.6102  ORF Transcript_2037/g.6102 Transcript_2037/m.6102 type:complete len:213 (+) Transcript_2037:88-726(+)